VRKKESGPSPEEPDQSGTLYIVVSPFQFEWLTKQSEFLGITKHQLVADTLEEWLCRNSPFTFPVDPAPTIQKALTEFMQRHHDEFLSLEEPT
jgi:hypothetical protein